VKNLQRSIFRGRTVRCATTTLVSRSSFLERSAVSVVQAAMSLTQYRRALMTDDCAKSLHIPGYLHLFAERQALKVAHDGLDDCHDQTPNIAAEKAKWREKRCVGSPVWSQSTISIASTYMEVD
jgi:hypothetical protein